MASIEILEPGPLTTVQDRGRFGHADLGVSACGAADSVSLRLANRLAGNEDDAAAFEMTLAGGSFRFDEGGVLAITGSDFRAELVSEDRSLGCAPWGRTFRVGPDAVLRFGPTDDGARAYLAVRGGLSVPRVLGSASTHVRSALGGIGGRPARRGDRVEIGREAAAASRDLLLDRTVLGPLFDRRLLRVMEGPEAAWFTSEARRLLLETPFEVTEQSDRMGLRLDGPSLERCVRSPMLTEGVGVGALQVPEGGQPILLFVDQGTTGGYPRIAHVVTADLHRVGQLRPRERVRFERVSLDQAWALLREREERLRRAVVPA